MIHEVSVDYALRDESIELRDESLEPMQLPCSLSQMYENPFDRVK